jgi:hypothetical protein
MAPQLLLTEAHDPIQITLIRALNQEHTTQPTVQLVITELILLSYSLVQFQLLTLTLITIFSLTQLISNCIVEIHKQIEGLLGV